MSKPKTTFLNVDLEVFTTRRPSALTKALEAAGAYALHTSATFSAYELDQPHRTAEATIRAFVRILRDLPPAARRAWDGATRRVFDIGIQAEDQPHAFIERIRPATLRQVADLRAEIVVMIYAPARDA